MKWMLSWEQSKGKGNSSPDNILTNAIVFQPTFAAVKSIPVIKDTQADLPERFFGSNAIVIDSEKQAINNFISAEWITVCLPEDGQDEDRGALYLFPIEDGKFCLQL